jgi:hypothetical protein
VPTIKIGAGPVAGPSPAAVAAAPGGGPRRGRRAPVSALDRSPGPRTGHSPRAKGAQNVQFFTDTTGNEATDLAEHNGGSARVGHGAGLITESDVEPVFACAHCLMKVRIV